MADPRDFRYFRVTTTESTRYYRADPDKPAGKQVRVSDDGRWVDTKFETVDQFLALAVFVGEVVEIPVDEAPCHLCMVAAGTVTRRVVQEWDDALVIRPWPGGVCDGHLLVLPKRHVRDALVDVELSTRVHFRALSYAAEYLAGGALNVATSRGKAATQTEPHLHIHLVPREFGDGLPFLWDKGGKP
jgi:histidine triad (HIT) family protein